MHVAFNAWKNWLNIAITYSKTRQYDSLYSTVEQCRPIARVTILWGRALQYTVGVSPVWGNDLRRGGVSLPFLNFCFFKEPRCKMVQNFSTLTELVLKISLWCFIGVIFLSFSARPFTGKIWWGTCPIGYVPGSVDRICQCTPILLFYINLWVYLETPETTY